MIENKKSCSPGEFKFYSRIEPQLQLVIDAGASDTFFSKLSCEVHFFEPDTTHFNNLNTQSSDIHYYNKLGLGNSNCKKILYNSLGSTIKWDTTKIGLRAMDMSVTEEIEIIKIEDYLDNLDISHISLFKVDIEGNDYEAIEGLGKYINSCDYITFEFQGHINEWNPDGPQQMINKYRNLLSGYDLFNINNDGSISEVTDRMIRGFYNFVAINKNYK